MKLLFICTHNRCRSILAEAVTNHIAGADIIAASAGSSPQGAVHPLSLKYLKEHDIPISGLRSQSWDEFEYFRPDAILTLCDSAAKEICPVWFDESVQVHWGLVDPSKSDSLAEASESQQRDAFNETIGILERRIRALMTSTVAPADGDALRNTLRQIAAQIH